MLKIKKRKMVRTLNTLYSILIIAILISCFGCTSTKDTMEIKQNPIVYYDLNNNQVSEADFYNQINYAYNIDVFRYHDTVTEAFTVIRFEEGTLTKDQLNVFKSSIETSGNIDISFEKPLRIVYYTNQSEMGDCLTYDRNLDYQKKVRKYFSKYQTLYISNSSYQFDPNKYDIIIDKDDVIEKLFFRQKHTCSNIILISADGTYSSCIGDGCEYYENE